jgi:hypothetical protein
VNIHAQSSVAENEHVYSRQHKQVWFSETYISNLERGSSLVERCQATTEEETEGRYELRGEADRLVLGEAGAATGILTVEVRVSDGTCVRLL